MAAIVVLRGVDIVLDPLPNDLAQWLQRFASGVVFSGAAILCVLRGRVSPAERFAWRSFALALLRWGAAAVF